ncbi:MAG: hypothetical protein CL910_20235 [Deltaproteobacteria bacterium]|nr:hypothetical protein [Deltaproteobacteria bacterium]
MPIPEPLVLALPGALDLRTTLGPVAIGRRDPTTWIDGDEAVRATRTASGPATVHYHIVAADRVEVRAFGPGAEEALERAADWIGLADDPPPPDHYPEPLRRMARSHPGIRFARAHSVIELLVPAVLQQKVSGKEAERAFGLLMRRGPFRSCVSRWPQGSFAICHPPSFPASAFFRDRAQRSGGWGSARREWKKPRAWARPTPSAG